MKLYHYTKFETAVTKILPFMRLRLNPLVNMNDPLENLLHATNVSENIFETNLLDSVRALKVQKEWQALSFSIDRVINKDIIEGSILQRMWAQYGQSNAGICLVIDFEKFKEENIEIIKEYSIIDQKVNYNNWTKKTVPHNAIGQKYIPGQKPKPVDPFDVSPSSFNNIALRDFFFTKDIDWEAESEYRFIVHSKNKEEIFLKIKDSLDYVILGPNFSKHLLPSVKQLVNVNKIQAIKIDKLGALKYENLPDYLIK